MTRIDYRSKDVHHGQYIQYKLEVIRVEDRRLFHEGTRWYPRAW